MARRERQRSQGREARLSAVGLGLGLAIAARRRHGEHVRIDVTPQAEEVVTAVRAASPGKELVFVFGSGCCEGTAPHLFTDYTLTPGQERIGVVGGVGVFADAHVRGLYADRTLVIDAEADPLADGFSAEIPLGWRFVLRQV